MEILIVLLVVGFGVIIYMLTKKDGKDLLVEKATLEAKIEEKERVISYLKSEIERVNIINNENNEELKSNQAYISELQTKLHEQKNNMEEKLLDLKANEEKLKQEFTNLANEILEKSSKKLHEENQKGLGQILTPVKTQIEDFKKKVEDVYDKESKDRSALQNELKNLKDLNLKISTDALNLTNALKGQNKQQGIWGEMVLEKVLESSGLREGHEYQREVSLKSDEERSFRPDVVVNLPDERHIIIDAKTSLTAYNEYVSAENEEEKESHIKSHLLSIKEHIRSLADKKYENLQNVNSLDFIFMFVPIEGALMLALESDVNLYDFAFKQKIILVSPTTLLVALRAVENTWRYEKQAQSIADVAKRAEELYGKFVGFITDLEKVGDSLKKANDSYNDSFKKLSEGRGNLVGQVEKLKEVSNIKPKKEIPKKLLEE
ncbi:MAG: DNA recombination protein RmuC [Campylobacterales bacterium]|nr:DNA recombination protein RmuC [Campylobacterales bacterium]